MKKKGTRRCLHQDTKSLITPDSGFTEEDDDTKIVKSRVSGFSRAKLEAGRNGLGLCTATDESKSCCCVFSRPS